MGTSDGTASPTESRDGSSNAKKRLFGQQPGENNNCTNGNSGSNSSGGGQMVVSSAESLVALETGLLKLERENCHQHGAGHLHFQISNEIDARMPLRARLQELATFVAWFALIASCTMQYPMVWVAFWNHVQALRVRMGSFHRRTVALPLWGLWVAALFCYRRTIYRRVAPDLGALFMHAEVFACVVLVMTVTVNFASYVHTPADPLFDIGFMVIPEQTLNSPWRPVSDTLTALLPAIALLRGLFMDRKQRVALVTGWFRLVSIVYMLRCLTIGLTSMPGPAPHCRDKSLYNPPTGWHEIATRMGVMVGDFSSCGDLLFSGHAAFTTTTMLVFVKSWRGHPTYRVWKVLGVVYLLTMCTLAIAGRKHYTVDIALGILIASLTFFRFENGWRASLNGGAASASASAVVKASYDPRTEKKNQAFFV